MSNDITLLAVASILIPDVILRQAKVETEGFTEMQETIRLKGRPDYPVLCRHKTLENGSTIIELIDGRQRLECCKNLGLETIPAIFQEMSDKDAIITQMRLNLNRIEQDPMEVAKALAKAIAMDPTQTSASLGQQIGKSPKYVEDRLRLTAIKNDDTRKAISAGEIIVGNALALAKAPAAIQDQLVDHAKTMKNEEFVQTVAAATTKFKEGEKGKPKVEEAVVYNGPVAKRKSLEDMIAAVTNSELAQAIADGNTCKTLAEAVIAGIKWAMDMDANGAAAQEAAWKQKQDEKAAKDAERKAASEAKKAANEALKGSSNPILDQISEQEKVLREKAKKTREALSTAATKLHKDGVYATIGEAVAACNAGKHPDLFAPEAK